MSGFAFEKAVHVYACQLRMSYCLQSLRITGAYTPAQQERRFPGVGVQYIPVEPASRPAESFGFRIEEQCRATAFVPLRFGKVGFGTDCYGLDDGKDAVQAAAFLGRLVSV